MDFYEPPISIWEVIKANTGAVELDEIRSILGPGDVDLSLDLRLEVESLLEIWKELRDEKKGSAVFQFVDQNEIRRRLISEIKIFIDSIKENPDVIGVVRIENLTSRPLVKLALAEFDRSFRTSTSFGSDGRDTPTAVASPSRSTPSRNSQLSFEDIVQLKDGFKIDRVLEIVQHLRTYLAEEIAQLKEDVNYLRNCIEEENDFLTMPGDRPTVSELRSERNEVEAEVRWASENAALLRPLPPQSKRHGSLMPLDSSRPPSASSVNTITTQLAQIPPLSCSISPPHSPKSYAADSATIREEERPLSSTTPIEQISSRPHPPSDLKHNIRILSGKATMARFVLNKHATSSGTAPNVKPSKHGSLVGNKTTTDIVVSKPPVPPLRKSVNVVHSTEN